MSLLAALTVKVSVILLLALVGAVCLRTRSAAARHWLLTVGVVSACGAPAVHVLPTLPLMQVAPVGPLAWSVGGRNRWMPSSMTPMSDVASTASSAGAGTRRPWLARSVSASWTNRATTPYSIRWERSVGIDMRTKTRR